MPSIFLSASLPSQESVYFEQCDPALIQSALNSCLHTVLGNKHLVFGGHPSITPLVLAVCETLGVQDDGVVTIFQSLFFKRYFPKENSRFAIAQNTPELDTREQSLALMRQQMIEHQDYEAAVFIGGQDGILDECAAFKQRHPNARILAVTSAGGAAATIKSDINKRLDEARDYAALFAEGLNIFPRGCK